MLKALETPANLPFSRELWRYDPSSYIGKVREPIEILIGKKDIQVDWVIDGKFLESSLSGHKDASFDYPDNANHVLKHEELPRDELTAEYVTSHYNSPNSKLDSESVNLITNWLEDHIYAQ